MNFTYIIIAGISATSFMTLFSYIVSYINKSEFKEPELLNALISSSKTFPVTVPKNHIIGWVIHYFIGLLFVAGFDLLWKFTNLSPSVTTGILLGFIAGIIGISGWTVFFKLNSDPPDIKLKDFYVQLLIAHVIFGIMAAVVKLWM